MASGDISVSINSETKAFKLGVQSGIIEPLEDAEKALDDLGRSRGAEQLEDDLRQAQRTTEKLADETKTTARAIERSYRDAGADIKKGIGAGLDDVKKESAQSGAEAAASFRGEFSDVTDFTQEVAANLGPAGIAGGLMIGAITAVATQAAEAWNEKIQGIKDSTASMWQAAAEEGQAFLDGEAIRAEAHRIMWDETYDEQYRAAEEAGVSRAELAAALATGEGEVFDRVHRQILAAREEEQQAAMDAMAASTDGNVALQDATAVVNSELARTVSILEEKAKATDASKEKAREAGEIEKLLQEQSREQTKRTMDAAQARYEGIAAQYANPIRATVELGVVDRASAEVDRIVRGINNRRASLGVNVYGIGGRQIL